MDKQGIICEGLSKNIQTNINNGKFVRDIYQTGFRMRTVWLASRKSLNQREFSVVLRET